jgi:hypothetical protein
LGTIVAASSPAATAESAGHVSGAACSAEPSMRLKTLRAAPVRTQFTLNRDTWLAL